MEQTTKFNYGNGSFINDDERKEIMRVANRVTDNANFRVIPFMLAAGIEPTKDNVMKTSCSLEDLKKYFFDFYKKNHSSKTSSEILGDIIDERIEASFKKIYHQSCASLHSDEAFRSDMYLNPDHVDFYDLEVEKDAAGEITDCKLTIDTKKVEIACTVELTEDERQTFDKICEICDKLNDLFEIQKEANPTRFSAYFDEDWHKIIECVSKNDGKPAFRPSLPLRTDLLKIKF